MAETLPPDDVIPGILAKLPVKSLLRFKCVCKTWYSTISDPEFCNKLHRKRPSVLICQNSERFSTITIESLLSTTKHKSPTPLPLPWEDTNPLPRLADRGTDRDGNYLIGSCNGLVCVQHKSSQSGRDDLILWNPSARKFRILPSICYRVGKESYEHRVHKDFYEHFVWFGYDELIHDYKLVWVDYQQKYMYKGTRLYVFTLKSNAWRRDWRREADWRRVSDSLLSPARDGTRWDPRCIGVLSNGAIHWRIRMNGHNGPIAILALDLAREIFKVLDFANYPFDPREGGSCLVGGCSCGYDAGIDAEMNLQIMKEYGWQGIVLPKWETLLYYPILFSSGKEILAVFNRLCHKHARKTSTESHRIIKFRIEEGAGEKVSSPETLMYIRRSSNVVLHMEESLVSLQGPH